MKASNEKRFECNYTLHLQHLKLKGLQPKTIEAYSRAIRRVGEHFDGQIDNLSEQQLTDYFSELMTPMDPGGVQTTLHRVVEACGLKKRSRPTACATAMQPT